MCMCMCPFAQDLSILATDPGVNICPKKSETVYRPIWAFWNCLACSTRKSPLHTDQIIRRNWPRYMYLWNSLVRRAPLFSSLCVYTACLCCDWWGVWPGQGTLLGLCNHSGSTKPHMSPNTVTPLWILDCFLPLTGIHPSNPISTPSGSFLSHAMHVTFFNPIIQMYYVYYCSSFQDCRGGLMRRRRAGYRTQTPQTSSQVTKRAVGYVHRTLHQGVHRLGARTNTSWVHTMQCTRTCCVCTMSSAPPQLHQQHQGGSAKGWWGVGTRTRVGTPRGSLTAQIVGRKNGTKSWAIFQSGPARALQ